MVAKAAAARDTPAGVQLPVPVSAVVRRCNRFVVLLAVGLLAAVLLAVGLLVRRPIWRSCRSSSRLHLWRLSLLLWTADSSVVCAGCLRVSSMLVDAGAREKARRDLPARESSRLAIDLGSWAVNDQPKRSDPAHAGVSSAAAAAVFGCGDDPLHAYASTGAVWSRVRSRHVRSTHISYALMAALCTRRSAWVVDGSTISQLIPPRGPGEIIRLKPVLADTLSRLTNYRSWDQHRPDLRHHRQGRKVWCHQDRTAGSGRAPVAAVLARPAH